MTFQDGSAQDDAAWAPRRAAPPAAPPAAPRLLAGYSGFTLVARGGDSLVYRAHQDGLGRDVAVKVVQLDDPETIARFRRELEITVRLGRQHPHIVTVLDTGTTTTGHPCFVMDYFELGSLQDRLVERGPLPVSDVVNAGSVVADALAFAHGQGVLHRDVKPQNVLVLPTSYVLADFGLARAVDAAHSASLERFSYRHASPQVLDGEPPAPADDIYSLGSTLFTLLDGRPPFAAADPDDDSALAYLRRARTEAPRQLRRDDLPDELAAVVARCLARDPGERFADADELRRALDAVPTETRSWAPGAAPPAAAPATVRVRDLDTPEPPGRQMDIKIAEPEPVAVSALAHLDPPPPPDTDATGLRPDEEPAPAETPPRRSRRWIAFVAAFVLAVGVGAGIELLRDRNGGHPNAAPPPSSTTPSTTPRTSVLPSPVGPIGTVSVSNLPSTTAQNDPALAPTVTSIRRQGGNVTLAFTDPTHGTATFVVLLADGTQPVPVATVDAGHTGVTVSNLSAGRHCFVVMAVAPTTPTTYGRSKQTCTD